MFLKQSAARAGTAVERPVEKTHRSYVGPLLALLAAIILTPIIAALVIGPPADPPPTPQEKAQAEALAKIEAIYGRQPKASPVKGTVYSVDEYLQQNLKDPKSLEYIQWYRPEATEFQGVHGWLITVRFRAKNSFGGFAVEQHRLLVRNEKVVHVFE